MQMAMKTHKASKMSLFLSGLWAFCSFPHPQISFTLQKNLFHCTASAVRCLLLWGEKRTKEGMCLLAHAVASVHTSPDRLTVCWLRVGCKSCGADRLFFGCESQNTARLFSRKALPSWWIMQRLSEPDGAVSRLPLIHAPPPTLEHSLCSASEGTLCPPPPFP